MGHIFISYSHKDSDYVHRLQETLQEEGFDAWIDDRIDYGDEWLKVIQRHLDECDAFLIVMSNNSFESDMVQNEVTRAREKKKPIFPVLLEGDNWLIVQAKQFVDVRNGSLPTEKFYRRLEEVTPRKNEKAEREAVEKAAQEKEKREDAEKAERERTEKAARAQLERDAAEKARQKKIEQENAERIAKQQEKRETAERYKRQRAKYRAAQIDILKRTISTTLESLRSNIVKELPRLRVVGFAGIAIALFWLGWKNLPISPSVKTFSPSATSHIVLPAKTLTLTPASTPTKTHLFTQTPTFTATATITRTPVPPSSILFQKDFEDGVMGAWQLIDQGGIWTVEQEPDGNHYLCGTGPSVNPPQIWYRDKKVLWTEYALETRVKFIKGHTLFIILRDDLETSQHYGVAFNGGFSLMKTWSMISGNNIPVLPYPDEWYTVRAAIKGDLFNARIESTYLENPLFQESTLKSPVVDHGGIGYVIGNGDKVCFDDIKVWSLK